MARSTYIYMLAGPTGVLAAFTVKRELIAFLLDDSFPGFKIWRTRDGQSYTSVDVTDQINIELNQYRKQAQSKSNV